MDDAGVLDETSYGGGLTTSNLESILADNTPIELANPEMDREGSAAQSGFAQKTLELGRTSRPSSVHT